jgi:signal peptide peptidase SppA
MDLMDEMDEMDQAEPVKMVERVEMAERMERAMKHLEQYFKPIAMEERVFRGLAEHTKGMDIQLHGEEFRKARASAKLGDYRVTSDGYAVIDVIGPMSKYGSSFNSAMPFGTIGVRKAVRNAASDPAVKAILLVMDTPGGISDGTNDLALDVKKASGAKPVVAYAEDMTASAGYWVASQADLIVANPGALVGSLGTYMVVDDLSGMYEGLGVKTHVIRTGPYTGAGVQGDTITEAQIADFQRVVEEVNGVFMAAVQAGRGMTGEQIDSIATGQIWETKEAKRLGLVDRIGGYEDALKVLGQLVRSRAKGAAANNRSIGMGISSVDAAEPTRTKDAASYEDLVACLPGADAEFICGQLGKKASVDQAQSAWMEEQNRRIASATAEADGLKAKAAEAEAKAVAMKTAPGVETLGAGKIKADRGTDGTAEQRWNAAIAAKRAQGLSQAQAVIAVVTEDPELHEAYLTEYNDAKRWKRD